MNFPVIITYFKNGRYRPELVASVDDFPVKKQFTIIMQGATQENFVGVQAAIVSESIDDDIPF